MAATTSAQRIAEHAGRLLTAINLGTPDRVPVALGFDAFAAKQTGITIAEFISSPLVAGRAMIKTMEMLGDVDAIQASTFTPGILALALWLSEVQRPGKELPDDSLWQMNEQILMQPEEYDRIAAEGWQPWLGWYMQEHLSKYLPEMQELMEAGPVLAAEYAEKGILVMCGPAFTIPYEMFCGARSIREFMLDLHRIPDRVQAAMDVGIVAIRQSIRDTFAAMPVKPMATWVGGWRSAGEFLSPKLWDRFVWPYFVQEVEEVLAAGVTPVLHFDSDWTRDLARFKELPKASACSPWTVRPTSSRQRRSSATTCASWATCRRDC